MWRVGKLVEAGVDFIQLDEPSYAVHKHSPKVFVDLFNQTVEGVEARIGLHLCFGNYIGRPVAHRTYAPLFPHILDINAVIFYGVAGAIVGRALYTGDVDLASALSKVSACS